MNSPPLRVTNAVLITAADARIVAEAIELLGGLLRPQGSKLTPAIRQLADRLAAAGRDADVTPGVTSLASLPIDGHDDGHDLLTANAAAAMLGVTPGAVRALAVRGTLRAHRLGDRWLFDGESVRERAAQG